MKNETIPITAIIIAFLLHMWCRPNRRCHFSNQSLGGNMKGNIITTEVNNIVGLDTVLTISLKEPMFTLV